MSWPRSFAMSGRSIDRASLDCDCKFNPLALGQIQDGADIASADQPIPFAELRSQVRVRAATLLERIGALCADGRIVKTNGGYRLAST
jgi:hypothetical protein